MLTGINALRGRALMYATKGLSAQLNGYKDWTVALICLKSFFQIKDVFYWKLRTQLEGGVGKHMSNVKDVMPSD